MENRRYELKKQVEKHYEDTTTNSKRKRHRILHLLEDPSVNEIVMIQEYIDILKSKQAQNSDCGLSHNPNPIIVNNETQFDINTSKLCGEKENVPNISKSAENKDNSKHDLNFKIPGKVTKQSRRLKKSQVKTPTRPPVFHSIFDKNLLRENGGETGCECTALNNLRYENPFFKDLFEEISDKKITIKCAVVYNNTVNRAHVLTFTPIEEFQHIITKMKPTLYVSEYVTGTQAAIGIKYSLIIKLAKDNIFVGTYVAEYTFSKAEKKFLEIRINDYKNFDTIYYSHVASNKPEVKLNLEKVYSIRIGNSILKFLSNTIQWTDPGPKVIVEKVEQLPGDLFY